MQLPICQSSSNRFIFIDGNGIPVDGLEVCDALNNTAVGPWQSWPPTKLPKEGDQVLADMGLVDKTFHDSEYIVLYFIKGVWKDSVGQERPHVVKFAYINETEENAK